MNDPHHDHQDHNMKVSTPTRRYDHHCKHCLVMGGKHSNACPVKNGAGAWHEVNGIELDEYKDGWYLVETVKRDFDAVYLFNDDEKLYLYADNAKREVDPQEVVRIARIVEV